MTDVGWEHFPHGADIGVRGVGNSKEEAFERAAAALIAVITEPASVTPEQCINIECTAPDDELLLVEWLNAVIYEIATRKMLFARFQVVIDGNRLAATAWGEAMNPHKHELAVEVKGATCTELSVKRDEDGKWIAQCIVDV